MKKHHLGIITLCGVGLLLVIAGCQYPAQQTAQADRKAMETEPTDAAANSSESKGSCGNCQVETATKGKEDGCSSDCNACSTGNEETCQCENDAAQNTTESHVNSMSEDRDIFHDLLKHHDKITRSVTNIESGVQTTTESDDPAIAAKIKEHVDSMHGRIKDVRRLRNWDDLFVKIFKHADEIDMKVVHTEKGVKVIETSDNPEVAKLIQQHAVVVSGFAKYGFEEARKNHPVENAVDEK